MEFVLKEIQSVKRFVSARIRHDSADANLAQMLNSFTSKLTKLINNHNISSASDISIIMNELADSPYGQEHTATIINCLEQKMMQANGDDDKEQDIAHHDECVGKSKLTCWWNYFTESDWVVFNGGKSWYTITELAVHRGRSFGCVDLHEQSVKWLLAFLLGIHYRESAAMPTALQKYRKFNDLKALFETAVSNADQLPPSLACYPKDPSGLPIEMQACYQNDPAVNKDNSPEICSLANLAKQIPMRRNSALMNNVPAHEFETPRVKQTPTKQHRLSSNSLGSACDSPMLDTPKLESPKLEPPKLESPKLKPGMQTCNFCPSCGNKLLGACTHDHQPVTHEPADEVADAIRRKLRINGMPVSSYQLESPKFEPPKLESPKPKSPNLESDEQPPTLDPHAQAAIAALQTRRDLKKQEKATQKQKQADRPDEEQGEHPDDEGHKK